MPESLPVLQGRFLLQHKLGEGGMAEVWRAYDNRLGVWRAVKLLLPDYVKRTKLRKRFESEARAMALLEHPNIVRVYDVGSEGTQSWIVMELCDGGSLETWLDTNGPMPAKLAVDVTLQFSAGVAHAHSNGVIHRDIKPQNVLISAKGVCKVTDFGIAHFEDASLTRTGTVMGTLGFMAPEQRSDAKKVDRRSDTYSVVATLFTLVTGRVEMDLFAARQDPTKLDGVPEALCPVIERGVSYHRDDRYQTIEELAKVLQEARRKLPSDPTRTPSLAAAAVERPARPSMVEQALAEAAREAGDTAVPPVVPGETLLPSYDLFEGASIPPSLRRAAEQQAPNRRQSAPPIATPAPRTPASQEEPRAEEPALVEEVPAAARNAKAIPWVPSTQRGRKDEDFDFETLYVQSEEPKRGPAEIGVDVYEEGARVVEPAIEIAPERNPDDDEEDPGKTVGKAFDPMWALREAWKFLLQLLSGMLQFASQPVQYVIWPVVAALAIAAVASFHGASSVVNAQTATTTDLHVLTASLDRSSPDLIEDIVAEGGNRTLLESQWTRYEGAADSHDKEEAALGLSRLMEEQVVRLDEPESPEDALQRKALQSRVQALARQRSEFVDAQDRWRAAAATTTGKLAVQLGLADAPPPR